MVGLAIAITQGLVEEDIFDRVFGDHMINLPVAPSAGEEG